MMRHAGERGDIEGSGSGFLGGGLGRDIDRRRGGDDRAIVGLGEDIDRGGDGRAIVVAVHHRIVAVVAPPLDQRIVVVVGGCVDTDMRPGRL